MAAVNFTGTSLAASYCYAGLVGEDIRVWKSDIVSNWALHLTTTKCYITKNGAALVNTGYTFNDLASLSKVLITAFPNA